MNSQSEQMALIYTSFVYIFNHGKCNFCSFVVQMENKNENVYFIHISTNECRGKTK